MKISVKAKPNSSVEKVEKIDDLHFVISVKEPPVNGLANKAIIMALSRFLNIHASRIKLATGFSSREKVFEVI